MTVQELSEQRPAIPVVDVRRPSEWTNEGHLPGAMLRPLDGLKGTLPDVARTEPIAVHCKGGYRSTIACSILEAAGFTHAINLQGGFDAWARAGMPVEK